MPDMNDEFTWTEVNTFQLLTDEELMAHEAEFKLLSEGQHPTLEWEAEFLGWNEVVAINRHAGTLTLVIMGSD